MTDAPHHVTQEGRDRLGTFLAFLTRQADSDGLEEATRLAETGAALKTLVSHDDWLEESFAAPDPARYCQYLLFCDPLRRFSVVSFVWGPGQQTPIHDHTVWGLVGILRGAEISEAFEIRNDEPVSLGEERLDPGDVIAVSPSIGDIHRVRNAFDDRASVSIHVYGGDIGAVERHVFPSDGGVKHFISGYANRLLPNPWGPGPGGPN